MNHIFRIAPEKAYRLARSGDALLVCAYDDPLKCDDKKLPYAVDRQTLHKNRDHLPRSQEIIFYCG